MQKLYEHTVTVCFTIKSEYSPEQTENITTQDLLNGMAQRLVWLLEHPERAEDAFEILPSDWQEISIPL